MGKITKLYQTRRILAMILAVTMVVGMIPSTALAAPGSDAAQTVENDAAVQATEGTEEDLSPDATTSDDDNMTAGTEEIVTGADDTAADTGDTVIGDDNTTANAGENASGSNAAADADNTPSATDEPAPRAEKPVYEIVTDDLETKAVYTGSTVFNLNSNVYLKKTENGSSVETPALSSGVRRTWKVLGTDGNYTAMETDAQPINAGTYELTLSYPAVADVHDGAEKTVICEITKAPVEIKVGYNEDGRITVAPGTLKETVKPEITAVESAGNAIDLDDLVLTVDKVRDAITGTEIKDGTKLKKNGDYVMDITPVFKADADATRQAVYANYELESFTADIVVEDLIDTIVEVKLTDKWKPDEETEATTVTAKVYDGKPAEAPKLTDDYTYVVKYYDGVSDAAPDGYVELKDQDGKAVPVTGEWAEYSGCELDQDGKVMPPTDADIYTYYVVYAGEEGIYAGSRDEIEVKIVPATLTVEATNKESLKVLEGTTAQEVLSKITYKVMKVTNKDGNETTEDVTKAMKAGSVWGTGFDDSNVSQIYEPLFTLQESEDGSSWKNIEDEDYREPYTLAADKKYRVIYDGKKAIYNADGTYSHRTGVNDDSNINGVDYNYTTDIAPTAADKAIAVEVTPGAEVEIDITKLLGDKKGALTIADLTAKTYDGKPIYSARSEYKNVVGVKPKEGTDTIKTLLREFTYTWERYYGADDLLDAQIQEENQTNGFESWGPADEDDWYEMSSTDISPKNAGVYRLTITYEDQYDDGKLYYAKKPAVVYYAIDPVQVKIVPKGEYKELAGHNGYDLLRKKHDSSTYELQAADGSKTSPIVSGDFVEPKWEIIETRQQEAPAEPSVSTYDYDSCWDFNFERNDKVSYALQGSGLGQFYYYEDEEEGYVYDFYSDRNYTCYSSEKIEIGDANASGKKEVNRKDTFLNETAPITVNPMGTNKLMIEVDADKWGTKEKVYDAKPFTLDELLKGGVVTVKDETGKEISGKELSDLGISYEACTSGAGYTEYLEWITNVGEYTLYAFFYGNETYAPLKSPENPSEDWNPDDWGVKIGTFKITQRTISLKAALPETYTAGVTAGEVLNAIPGNITVGGYAPDDAEAFTEYSEWDEEYEENYYYMWAWSDEESGLQDPSFRIYEKGAKTPVSYYTTLTRDKVYEVRYDAENSSLTQFYNWSTGECSYVISTAAVAEFTVVKGNSTIESIDWGGIESFVTRVKNDDKDSMKRTVTMLEGIGFSSVTLDDGTELEGNLAAFRITPPAEYRGSMPSTAMYKNAITAENVNGYIVDDDYGDGFTVIFDAREGTKTFPIRWEDGYIETYTLNFNDAVKLGDLNNAVAPKSLAFNAPDKKMAVGASQQLDVKITKAQMGDVICLGYKSSDEKVLTVNENGYVTALKIGKANITVFPQHYVKGKLEPIPGAKQATVTITATKVTAPKTVKVTAHGSAGAYANINYDTPMDGYRREIYVVDNSKNSSLKKAADFEKILAGTGEDSWKENKWQGTFAIAPIYLDGADEALNRRRNDYTVQLSGLATKGAYTVYVRNVCAARTLADGSVITNEAVNESAAGTAVSFKTLKSELIDLKFELDDQADGVMNLYYSGDEVWDDGEYREIDGTYRIELAKIAKGTVNSATYGLFYTMPKDEAANGNDKEWIALPLKEKLDKDSYENPKLEYTLKDCWNKKTQRWEYGSKNDIASIDKKGKIKITGMTGEDQSLIVRVRDTQTGKRTYIALYIVAEADSVMAVKKSVTLSVGQTQYLGDLLAYKMGKQKLTSYPYADIDINAVKAAIKEQKQEQFFKLDQYNNLQAIAKGGSLKLDLTDRNVANSFGKDKATAAVTFKSTDLTPVKKVKAVDVINNRFDLTFTYTGGADAFLVEIADANKTIYSKKFARFDVAEYSETGLWANGEYDSKGNRVKDTYRIDFGDINIRLSKETQYTVKITALYDALVAKPATAKVKTTKIPAVGGYIDDEHRGGMSIQVGEYNGGRELNDSSSTLRVLSGNSYTLTANVEYNRGRVNDTLVWTVDNAKVATVKAAAGSYCITLKGVKPGSTVLEVKSKIWGNKVVARYDINVVAVGDAYKNTNRYYGDDEPAGSTSPSISNGGNNAPTYLPLSVGDPRKVTANQQEYFSFTAPVTGRYTMSADGDVGGRIYLQKTSYPSASNYGSGDVNIGWLQAGETVILTSRVSGAYYNNPGAISYYVEVRLAQSVETVSAGQTIEGTNAQGIFKVSVPEDGRYQFSIVDEYGSTQYLYLYNDENAAIKGGSSASSGSTIEYDMTKGEENSIWLKTSGTLYSGNKYTIRAEKISEDIDLATPANVTVAAGGKKYLMLTVAEDGFYKFSSQADSPSSDIRVTLQVNGVTEGNKYDSEFTFKQELQAGDQVCLVIQNTDSFNDYSFTVKAEEVEIADLTTATSINAVEGGIWQFTATETGMYEFSASESGAEVYLYESAADAFISKNSIGSGNAVEKEMKADDKIWLSVTLNGAENCQLSAKKISQNLDLTNGSAVTVGAGKKAYVMFSVSEGGYYDIAAANDTESVSSINTVLKINGIEVESNNNSSQFSFKKDLKQGDAVCLEITNTGTDAFTFSVKATEVTIEAIPEDTIQLAGSSSDTAYKFTAAEAGLYQFRMESEEQLTYLYLFSSMEDLKKGNNSAALAMAKAEPFGEDSDGGADGGSGEEPEPEEPEEPVNNSKQVCLIEILLDAGQTVYVNPRNESSTDNLAVILSGKKKAVSAVTVNGSQSIPVATDEIAQVTFTASTAGIYTFKANNATVDVTLNAYTAYTGTDSQSLYSHMLYNDYTMEQPLVLAANQTIIWTIESTGSDQDIKFAVELTKELKEIKVGDSLEATCEGTDTVSQATADGFVFRAPETGYYTFWGEANWDTYGYLFKFDQVDPETCLLFDTASYSYWTYDDDAGPGSNFAIKQNLAAGQTVYLKVRNYSESQTGTFNVCVGAGQLTFN